jgi:hypothetical protein
MHVFLYRAVGPYLWEAMRHTLGVYTTTQGVRYLNLNPSISRPYWSDSAGSETLTFSFALAAFPACCAFFCESRTACNSGGALKHALQQLIDRALLRGVAVPNRDEVGVEANREPNTADLITCPSPA